MRAQVKLIMTGAQVPGAFRSGCLLTDRCQTWDGVGISLVQADTSRCCHGPLRDGHQNGCNVVSGKAKSTWDPQETEVRVG